MPYLFLLLFVAIPLGELYILISVGADIGSISTILLCLATAAIGISLVRTQGLRTIIQARADLNRGELPAQHMLHGLLIAIAGILLFFPGFVTDALGFLLLFPALRGVMISHWLSKYVRPVQSGQSTWIEAEVVKEESDPSKLR